MYLKGTLLQASRAGKMPYLVLDVDEQGPRTLWLRGFNGRTRADWYASSVVGDRIVVALNDDGTVYEMDWA